MQLYLEERWRKNANDIYFFKNPKYVVQILKKTDGHSIKCFLYGFTMNSSLRLRVSTFIFHVPFG